jgi:LPS export ABC transporter protein LptC
MFLYLKFSIVSFFSLLIIGCSSSVEQIKNLSSNNSKPIEITNGVTMYYSDMGNSKMRLISPEVHRFEDQLEMTLECPTGMELTFYDSLENIESVLIADYGKLYTKEQYMIVKENVVFYNNNRDTLFTDLLNIYFLKDSIYTNRPVKVSSENGVILGNELVANSNFTFYRLLNIKNSHINYEESKITD